MFALLIPLVLNLTPQLAGMIFGSKGVDATAKVAGVVQTVVGAVADLSAPGGVAAAVAHIQSNRQAAADLAAKLADLHLQMQKEQDAEAEALRQDALDELKARLADTSSARDMAVNLAQAHSGLAYGSVVVSVVIVAAFGWATYSYQPPLNPTLPRFPNGPKYDSLIRRGDSPPGGSDERSCGNHPHGSPASGSSRLCCEER
jgi:hypothetical protein